MSRSPARSRPDSVYNFFGLSGSQARSDSLNANVGEEGEVHQNYHSDPFSFGECTRIQWN